MPLPFSLPKDMHLDEDRMPHRSRQIHSASHLRNPDVAPVGNGCRFNQMHEFDGMQRGPDPDVFVSEYAVTADGGWGNLKVCHTLPSITSFRKFPVGI